MKIEFGEFTLDWAGRQLLRAGGPVYVSPKALELLKVLIEHRHRAVSKAELHKLLWPATFVSDATLTSLVAELRGRIGDRRKARFVRTVHGFGYAFCGAATDVRETPSRAESGAGYWVVWENGQAALGEGENILGRAREVTVWLDSVSVSRRHARIVIASGEATIEDLGSKNGTRLGSERITSPCRLTDGDQIGLGSVTLTFRVLPAGASTESQSPRAEAQHLVRRAVKARPVFLQAGRRGPTYGRT